MILRSAWKQCGGLSFAWSVTAVIGCAQAEHSREPTAADTLGGGGATVSTDAECSCYACRVHDTLEEYCAEDSKGCPESLHIWLRCSAAGQLSSPGRDGYRLVDCGPVRVVEYLVGIGPDTHGWIYDEQDKLIAKVWGTDAGEGMGCGDFSHSCTSAFLERGTYELLSPEPAPADADSGSEANAEPLPECANL